MEVGCRFENVGYDVAVLHSMARAVVVETLLVAEKALLSIILGVVSITNEIGALGEMIEDDYAKRIAITAAVLRKSKIVPENKDADDTDNDDEDDDDEDEDGDDQDDDGEEEYFGDEGGQNEEEEDDDGPEANGEGGSDDDDEDDGEDDEDEDEDDEDEDEDDEEEDDEEELPQPPSKKRK